jgi:hypothetical protein
MKKIWQLFDRRIVWTIGVALLAIAAVPALVDLVLKALGSVHGASLHTWLLDYSLNANGAGAAGAAGAGAAAAAGSHRPKNPTTSPADGRTHSGGYTPTPGYKGPPQDDPAFKNAQQQLSHDLHANDPVPTPSTPHINVANTIYEATKSYAASGPAK